MTGDRDTRQFPMPDPSYFLDHYGRCELEACDCLKPHRPWLGRGCANWRPAGATSFDDLIARARGVTE